MAFVDKRRGGCARADDPRVPQPFVDALAVYSHFRSSQIAINRGITRKWP
jgi:hypothetical protein